MTSLQLAVQHLLRQIAGQGEVDPADRARELSGMHDISLRAPPPPLRARVDALRLDQVLDSLLDNAIKFSPAGGRIEILLEASDGAARIGIRDHGLGIPRESRERVFERFYQAHTETLRSGPGLGLFVSREIIRLHRGTITAEFPDDGGTRILIELPLGAVGGREAAKATAVGS